MQFHFVRMFTPDWGVVTLDIFPFAMEITLFTPEIPELTQSITIHLPGAEKSLVLKLRIHLKALN